MRKGLLSAAMTALAAFSYAAYTQGTEPEAKAQAEEYVRTVSDGDWIRVDCLNPGKLKCQKGVATIIA